MRNIENSMCHDIGTQQFEDELFDWEKEKAGFKSKIKFGEISYFTKQRFNWLQKKMLKICFGFEVEDVGIEV